MLNTRPAAAQVGVRELVRITVGFLADFFSERGLVVIGALCLSWKIWQVALFVGAAAPANASGIIALVAELAAVRTVAPVIIDATRRDWPGFADYMCYEFHLRLYRHLVEFAGIALFCFSAADVARKGWLWLLFSVITLTAYWIWIVRQGLIDSWDRSLAGTALLLLAVMGVSSLGNWNTMRIWLIVAVPALIAAGCGGIVWLGNVRVEMRARFHH